MPRFDEYNQIYKRNLQLEAQNPQVVDQNADNRLMTQQQREIYTQKQENLDNYYNAKQIDLHYINAHTRDKIFDYDATQLKEYFEKRFSNEDDFAARTEYYFRNFQSASKKREQYRELSRGENVTLETFDNRYSRWFHNASKRKSAADTASENYGYMARKIVEYQNDDNRNLTSVQKYDHKVEIMGYRLKAMTATAEVKSKSRAHEKYLKARAKLSCYMALKDQLSHYIAGEQNQDLLNTLQRKNRNLTSQINDTFETLKKVTPSALDMWRYEVQIDDRAVADTRQICRNTAYPNMNTDSARLLLNLEKIKAENRQDDWPRQLYFQDANMAALNKAESEKWSWNVSYTAAKEAQNPDLATIREKDLEAFERFNKMHIPTPQELSGKGTYKYVYNNLRDYYEIFYKALPYYTGPDVPRYVRERMNNQEFMFKLSYLLQVRTFIEFKLRKDNHIIVGNDGTSVVERQNQRRAYARDAEAQQLQLLQQRYDQRQAALQNPGQANIQNNQQINGNENINIIDHDNAYNNNSNDSSIRIDGENDDSGGKLDDTDRSVSFSSHYDPRTVFKQDQPEEENSSVYSQNMNSEEREKRDKELIKAFNEYKEEQAKNQKLNKNEEDKKEEDKKEEDKKEDKKEENKKKGKKKNDKYNIIRGQEDEDSDVDDEGDEKETIVNIKKHVDNDLLSIDSDDDDNNLIIEREEKKKEKKKVTKKGKQRVNNNVIKNDLPESLNEAYMKLEDQFKGQKVKKADMTFMKDVTKAVFEYDRAYIHSVPKDTIEQLDKKKPAGVDVRAIMSLMRPVQVDEFGFPINAEEQKKLALNVSECELLMDNKLSSRKDFLDRIGKEAVELMFTMDQLKDKKYIIKNKEKAIRSLAFMHNFLNVYNNHIDYYLNHGDPSIRNVLFLLVSGTEYVTTSTFYIQKALFSTGIKKPYAVGQDKGASTIVFDSKKMTYEQMQTENKRLGEMTPKDATLWASEINNSLKDPNGANPFDEDEVEERELLLGTALQVKDLGVGGAIVAKNLLGKNGDKTKISQDEIEQIIRTYCDPYVKKSKNTKKTDASVSKAIDQYRKTNSKYKETMDKNIKNDLDEFKEKEKKNEK